MPLLGDLTNRGYCLTYWCANCQARKGPEKVLFAETRPRVLYLRIPRGTRRRAVGDIDTTRAAQ